MLANRLSADGRFKVLLLEAVPRDNYLWIHIPIGYGKTMFHKAYNWGFYTDPEANMHDRKIYWPRGRGLGGSSSINGLIFIRGQSEDYDHWAQLGNAGWDWKSVLPYFIKSEHNSRGASDIHGADGPLWSSDIEEKSELMEAIIRGAEELGVPRTTDFNRGDQEGVGYFQLFTRNGWRNSSAVAYLKPARRRKTCASKPTRRRPASSWTDAGPPACAIASTASTHEVRAAREVILSAGALQSPQLLQLSGIGPADLLRRHGIDVVHDLPGVGQNLQDHLQFRLMFRVAKPITTNDDLRTLAGQARIGLKWLMNGHRAARHRNQPGRAVHAYPAGLANPRHPVSFRAPCRPSKPAPSRIRGRAAPSRSASCGRSRAAASRSDRPIRCSRRRCGRTISPPKRIASAPSQSIKYARRLAATGALRPYIQSEYKPGDAVSSDDEILEFARENGATIFHPTGTCKMGSDGMAVTDAQPARPRHRRASRRRLLDHADAGFGQYPFAGRDDRGKSLRHDPGGRERRVDGGVSDKGRFRSSGSGQAELRQRAGSDTGAP